MNVGTGPLAARPEPWASMVDIITASQALEVAIHANTYRELQTALSEANKQLGYAKNYLSDAAKAYPVQSQTYLSLANATNQAMIQLDQIAMGVPRNNFSSYQSGTIYAFQGTMSSLYSQISRLQTY
jgi:hypothetical protein